MVSIPGRQRITPADTNWEKLGRALLEYGGIPLAIFMAAGIIVNVARGSTYYHPFIDPFQNLPLYFVVNFWIVVGVYQYRQRYQKPLLLDDTKELIVAAIPAVTWGAILLYLLTGYAFFMLAIFRQDSLHTSFLPDFDDVTPEDDEDTTTGQSWGHLENVKDNMT